MASVTRAPVRPFEHHVLDFLAYLELERGLSRNTLEAYRSDLLQYGTYLERTGLDALAVTHGDVAGFLDELATGTAERPPAAPATLQRKTACLRSFYRHLRREEILQGDPTADLRGPLRAGKARLDERLPRKQEVGSSNLPAGTERSAWLRVPSGIV